MYTRLPLFLLLVILPMLACQSDTKMAKTSEISQDLQAEFVLEQWRGQVVVLDFWATWCRPCIEEIPEYNRLQAKYADQSFKIVGLAMASGSAADIEPYLSKYDIRYQVALGTQELAASFGGIQFFPTTFVLDKDMNVVKKYVGGGKDKIAELERLIPELLGKDARSGI
jgi:thiol-disulfide isomerase/thioredoxin